jgi:hypothetical protein
VKEFTWKATPDGKYEASERGQIRRLAPGRGATVGRLLRPRLNDSGYAVVAGGQFVHRLVAAAFLGPCPAGLEVDHRNGDKLDNRLENLEYVSRSRNLLRRTARGSGCGPAHGASRISETEVDEIRRLARGGLGYAAVAAEVGVTPETARSVLRGKTWRHHRGVS